MQGVSVVDASTFGHQASIRGKFTARQVENYFSQLKRSIDGTHHHVSVPHLPRYLAEFDFRYTYRNGFRHGADDSARWPHVWAPDPVHKEPFERPFWG